MKSLVLPLLVAAATAGFAQSLPLTFETATPGMLGYDNASFTIAANPSSVGNPSANAAKIVKNSATDLWAGGKITGMTSLDFSAPETSVLSLKIFTTEPVGTVIKIKLESPYTGEVDAVTTVSGAWETLLFDFGIPACTGSADLVIMPQPFTPGGSKIFYVDDIEQVPGAIATPLPGLPFTFEGDVTADHFFSFESAQLSVVANPDVSAANPSATVGKIVRHLGAPFGGSKITFANPIDFSVHTQISMKVWTTAPVGTPVTLKTEKPFWGVERSVTTATTGQWETLTFDFAGSLSDMPTLTFLFDFVAGSTQTGNGSAQSTFYFDDVHYTAIPLGSRELDGPLNVRVAPNPTTEAWTVHLGESDATTLRITDLSGKLVLHQTVDGPEFRIDASSFSPGIYLATLNSARGTQFLKLVKQ